MRDELHFKSPSIGMKEHARVSQKRRKVSTARQPLHMHNAIPRACMCTHRARFIVMLQLLILLQWPKTLCARWTMLKGTSSNENHQHKVRLSKRSTNACTIREMMPGPRSLRFSICSTEAVADCFLRAPACPLTSSRCDPRPALPAYYLPGTPATVGSLPSPEGDRVSYQT